MSNKNKKVEENKVPGCSINADEAKSGIGWFEGMHEHLEGFRLVPHLIRLLVKGQPVTLDQLSDASSLPVEEVEATLRRQPVVEWDEQGRVVGFGLTLRPTPHRFTVDGQTVYGWCASDTLEFPVVLGRSAVVESTCPATGQPIRVEVTPKHVKKVEPSSAVVSLVRPDPDKIDSDNGRDQVCGLGNFFASSEAAAEWLAANPEGMVHSVEQNFQLHREIMENIGWSHPSS